MTTLRRIFYFNIFVKLNAKSQSRCPNKPMSHVQVPFMLILSSPIILVRVHQQVTLDYPQSGPGSQLGDARPSQVEIFPSSPDNSNCQCILTLCVLNLDSPDPRSLGAPHIGDNVIPDHQSELSGDIQSRETGLEK